MRLTSLLTKLVIISFFSFFILPGSGQAGEFDDLMGKMGSLALDAPVQEMLMPGSVAAILCDFRNLFYGQVGTVIVAVSIFILGLMVFENKLRPIYAILIIGVIVIFTHPEEVTLMVMRSTLWGDRLPGIYSSLCWSHLLNIR